MRWTSETTNDYLYREDMNSFIVFTIVSSNKTTAFSRDKSEVWLHSELEGHTHLLKLTQNKAGITLKRLCSTLF